MRLICRYLLALTCLLALAVGAHSQSPKVVRTIKSANPEPQVYNWNHDNRLGIERGTFVGVKAYNRVLIRDESGEVVEAPFFHFTAKDLGELMNKMAKFPAETKVIDYIPGKEPIVDISAAGLKLGPVEKWPNKGLLGGDFCSMNNPPLVEDIQGRRAVHFDCNFWFYDTQYTAMVLDTMPAKSLKEDMPFTLSCWVLHPKDPDGDDPEMIMSWHSRLGNNGTGLDWKRETGRGDFYVMGLGGDLWVEPHVHAKPMMEWTHVAYVYNGGGIKGELRIYENGRLAAIGRSKFVPQLRDPVNITSNSVVLKGNLDTVDPKQLAYVRGYIGEYDAHHFGQLRHIGRWDQMNEIGLKPRGEFEIPFKDLKPGTLYYYRMFATEDPTSYENPGEPTRRWANGAGRFITATADGKPGQLVPFDTDRYVFLGTQWGSRWYSSFSGPAGLFRGYISDLKLYDRALTEDEISKEADAQEPYNCTPADKANIDIDKADFTWTSGTSTSAKFRFYIDTDPKKVADGTAKYQDTSETKIEGVKLQPGRTQYWRVDAMDAGGKLLGKGTVQQFHVTYGEPSAPDPLVDSSTSDTGYFRWTQTIGTLKEQRLYYSRDKDAVANGTVEPARLNGGQRDHFAPANSLNFGATYYWRVESVMADDTVVPGQVWSFKVIDYYTPEFDGPCSEPYTDGITPSRASKIVNGFGYPTISTPRSPESDLLDIMHATNRYLRKSPQLRNMLASHPCATTMASIEGPPCVDGYWCGSYGGLPNWNITMHEMGHQTLMNGLGPMYPDFYQRLTDVFNAHADNNAWLGDYASVNIHENIAVSGHTFLSASGREGLLHDDAPTFFLLSEYLPGDLAIDLHPAFGMTLDANNSVLKWDNRGGVEDHMPNGGQGYCPIPDTVGTFQATGSPKLNTVQGATAVVFGGSDALVWDRGLQYGFEKNRAWSVEFWARKDKDGSSDELLLGWGPEAKGVRLYWGGTSKAWSVSGNIADWPAKPEIGKWNHIVFIFEGGGLKDTAGPMRLFVNGKEILSKSYKLDLASKMPVQIGGLVTDGKVTSGFNGSLAHIQVYNYAISVYQVAEHYAQERCGYERTSPPNIGGRLYVDLDATQLKEIGAEDHFPMYPESLCKPWVRSWANKGILQGRAFNDISDQWHYSGSTPLYGQVAGLQALRFLGKDRMVGAWDVRGSMADKGAGTLEAVVYSEANSPDEVVLEWGNFMLDSKYLKPGWQHVAVSPNGGNSIVYINGEKVGEIPGVLKPGKLDHLNLGAHYDRRRESWYKYFNGAIAQIKVHEDALTQEQIAANAKQSPVFAAHTPSPGDESRVIVARKPALDWVSGMGGAAEPVFMGEDPARMASAGTFKPGEFKPELAGGRRYFWRIGSGPVWSFETTQGELVSLSADGLPAGPLASWKNNGSAGGRFLPSDRGNLLGMDVNSFNGEKGLRMLKGKKLTFKPESKKADALAKGPYTISFRIASDNFTEAVPILTWGKPGSVASIWFATRSPDSRLLTIADQAPRNSGGQYPPDQLKMVYPEGKNAQMAYAWKTITITYADGNAEMWYNTHRIDSRKVDLSVADLGDLTLGWDCDCNGNVLVKDLRIYDRAIKQADIELLAAGKEVKGSIPIVKISTDDLKADTRLAVLKNQGTLKGSFTSEPEIDRKPTVAQVNGRNAVTFNGVSMMTSDFILPDVLADAKPFTVEMWALQDEPSNGTRLLAFSQDASDRPMSFGMGSTADSKAIYRTFCNADWRVDGNEQPKQWVHLAWVYDGGEYAKIRLYRDGKLNAEYDYKTLDTLGGYPITLGGIMSPATAEKALFKGAISEVRVFDYPRTAQEIAESAKGK